MLRPPTPLRRQNAAVSSGASRLESFKVIVDLLRVIVWPIIVLGILFTFRQPIIEVADQLPGKFSAASKFGVGSLTFEIQEQARAKGNLLLAGRLRNLSPEAVRLLIELGQSTMILVSEDIYPERTGLYFFPDESRLALVRELDRSGLIEYRENLDGFLHWLRSRLFEVVRDQVRSDRLRPTRPLAPVEKERLTEMYYRLSPLGREAWNTVLNAVLEQLRGPGADSTNSQPATNP